MEIPVYSSNFESLKSGQPGRSQRGIWQGKNHRAGYRKTFSMKHTCRLFRVNVITKKFYSVVLDKTLWLKVSTTASRTIAKYGGIDEYLLKSSPKLIEDSQMGRYLKGLLIKKQKDPYFNIRYIPFTQRPEFKWKKREVQQYRNVPTIYIPPEAKKTDLSDMYYPPEHFETRLERDRRADIEKKLEQETDPQKKDNLKKQLNTDKYLHKLQNDMLTLMPARHKLIRDGLVRMKDRRAPKLNFIKTIENSENYTKLILGERYKHFSEDYPEVQLILQQTEQDRLNQNKLLTKMYKEYNYELGAIYDDKEEKVAAANKEFDPFKKKQGKEYDILKTQKKMLDEKARMKKKEKAILNKSHENVKNRQKYKSKRALEIKKNSKSAEL